MLFCKDLINEHLSQDFLALCPLVLTVQSILAAENRIDLSGTPCTCTLFEELLRPVHLFFCKFCHPVRLLTTTFIRDVRVRFSSSLKESRSVNK